KVLEYNCRFGDPEAQVILPLLENDLIELIDHSLAETLDQCTINTAKKQCAAVILASGGYPGKYDKNILIEGADTDFGNETIIFHAGTKRDKGQLLSSGGRVLAVSSLADSKEEALRKSYRAIEKIKMDGSFYRKDIGKLGNWLKAKGKR
ncbi:phosphoribosylamine--glycine ligase, partial [bacterium]|nr:phosphoribosylamine--glycine ligase [bacterium]